MTKKEKFQRLKVLYDTLTLMVRYEEEFREKLGYKGYQKKIDDVLDEIIFLKKSPTD